MTLTEIVRVATYLGVVVPCIVLVGATWSAMLLWCVRLVHESSARWMLLANVALAGLFAPAAWLVDPDLPLMATLPFAAGWAAMPLYLLSLFARDSVQWRRS
jgi:hypothetical protein